MDEDVVDARLAETRHVHLELGVDGLADLHAPLRDAPGELTSYGEAHLLGLHDGEDVADAERHVDRDLAHRLDLDALPGEHDERRSPAQRDLPNAVAVGVGDGLDDAGLRVDDHRSLGAAPPDHPGFDGHRRRADRALAARDVVATGIDEEEAEVRAGRDCLGHHCDQEAPVSARLQTEPGSKILVVLLKEVALVPDRGARELPEPAREQAHPDARGVKVDGRDDALGPHGRIIPQTAGGAARVPRAAASRTSGRKAPRSRPVRAQARPPREPRLRPPRPARAWPLRRTPGCGRRAAGQARGSGVSGRGSIRARRMTSKRSWRPPEFDESVPSASGTPRSSSAGSGRRPLPSIRLLAGLWTTVTPCRARRSPSSGVSQTPCATERRSPSRPTRAISATVPPGHTTRPRTA